MDDRCARAALNHALDDTARFKVFYLPWRQSRLEHLARMDQPVVAAESS